MRTTALRRYISHPGIRPRRRGAGLHLPRSRAVLDDAGRRCCAQCGAFIDPIDWCSDCTKAQGPCGTHTSLRKRPDAAFCDDACKARNRSTFIRDCL